MVIGQSDFFNFYFRSDEKLRELFSKSSLTVIKDDVQKNFPGELYRVKMYVTFLDWLWLSYGYLALCNKGIFTHIICHILPLCMRLCTEKALNI